MKNYHGLYLNCDVFLLADVLKKKIIINSLKNYRLCRSHYLGAPDFSWDGILKMAKIKIKLIPDPHIL